MTDWEKLIPEITTWLPPTSPAGIAACEGRWSLAIGYLSLFWPDFCEYDGMIFHGEFSDQYREANIRSWRAHFAGDRSSTEAMINHFHILDLQHYGLHNTVSEEQLRYLGQTIRAMWAAKLAQDFPHKEFAVEFTEGTTDNLWDYQVTFYQKPAAA